MFNQFRSWGQRRPSKTARLGEPDDSFLYSQLANLQQQAALQAHHENKNNNKHHVNNTQSSAAELTHTMPWICSHCTFENTKLQHKYKCEMCSSSLNLRAQTTTSQQQRPSASPNSRLPPLPSPLLLAAPPVIPEITPAEIVQIEANINELCTSEQRFHWKLYDTMELFRAKKPDWLNVDINGINNTSIPDSKSAPVVVSCSAPAGDLASLLTSSFKVLQTICDLHSPLHIISSSFPHGLNQVASTFQNKLVPVLEEWIPLYFSIVPQTLNFVSDLLQQDSQKIDSNGNTMPAFSEFTTWCNGDRESLKSLFLAPQFRLFRYLSLFRNLSILSPDPIYGACTYKILHLIMTFRPVLYPGLV